jgi:hypothetical protein
MALNDPQHPELARAAQDVEAPSTMSEPTHYGRGGAANIIEKDGQRRGSDARRKSEEAKRQEDGKGGLLAKGKELLNKLGKK